MRHASARQVPIVLGVLNARYSHTALGVRYLQANLDELAEQVVVEEFLIQDDPQQIVERILAYRPRVVALSMSIWNVTPTAQVIALLKRLDPRLSIVLGGPEVRFAEALLHGADVVIRGEGELVFPKVCQQLLAGGEAPALVDGGLPDLARIRLPYDLYSDEDIRQRIVYVEASRGCPFRCEFCLSSRDKAVRTFPLETLLPAFERLIQRGCRGFKFIDRTFNLTPDTSRQLLDFFYARWPRDGSGELIGPISSRQVEQGAERNESFFLHFEVVPDRFDAELVAALARFPAGGVQLEIGVQTLDPAVGARVGRRVDADATRRTLALLRERTGVHVHADLIVGLPGEDAAGFGRSFDALRAMGPDEIQVGILKLLPGAPLVRHVEAYGLVFNPEPPYDILQSAGIPFARMQELKRFARYYELYANSGRFAAALDALVAHHPSGSAFAAFDAFAAWLFARAGQHHAISQQRQYAFMLAYLTEVISLDREAAATLLIGDFLHKGILRYLPECLRPFAPKS